MEGSGHRGCVVEIVGGAGSGKSALAAALTQRVNDSGGRALPCSLVRGILHLHHSLGRKDCIAFAIRHPGTLAAALAASKCVGRKKYGSSFWIRHLTWHGALYEHVRARSQNSFIFADNGVFHYLGKVRNEVPRSVVSRLPLPDAVIELRVSACDQAWRRLRRDKPRKRLLSLEGARRSARAYATAFLVERDECEERRFLEAWNRECCDCALPASEMEEIIRSAARGTAPASAPRWRRHPLKEITETLGVAWREIDNSEGQPLAKTAEHAMAFLREATGNGFGTYTK